MQILALDIGSSSVKAGLLDGRRVARRARVGYHTHFDGAKAEIVPRDLLEAVARASREVLSGAGHRLDAIAYCTFSPGVVVTDQRGRPRTNIITHADRRSTEVAQQLAKRVGHAYWLQHAGNLPYPGSIGASTLAWLQKYSPAVLKNAWVGQASSLIGCHLTLGAKRGEWVIDPSQAAFLGLYDIHTGDWNPHLCRAVRVPLSALPRIAWADSILGTLGNRAAAHLGVTAGIPIVGGFIDTSAAVIQTPMQPGQLAHNAGSTDVLAMCLPKPIPTEGILTRPVGVGRVFAKRWLAVRTIATSGSALQWMRDTCFRELSDAAWDRAVRTACGRRNPIETLCDPRFAGERAALAQPDGASFARMRLGTTREDMLQVLVNGLTRHSAANYQMLRKLHRPGETVYATGGAKALGNAMHQAWEKFHRFQKLPDDNLLGLAILAQKTLGSAGEL